MKIVSIVSARPNFIKLASLHYAFEENKPEDWEHLIVHTGQHYDPLFSDVFFKELNLPDPVKNLGVKSGTTNEETVEATRKACVPVLEELKPDLVMIYGDVSGALGGAQAAHDLHIPLAHIEAGLRSFDEEMPEERNRKAIDHIAQLLFVTEKSGLENLEKENVTEGVHFVGNTMIDTLLLSRNIIASKILPDSEMIGSEFGLATLHRPSNVDSKEVLNSNLKFMEAIAINCNLVFPIHHRTHDAMKKYGYIEEVTAREAKGELHRIHKNVIMLLPLSYFNFIKLMSKAKFIVTDSGGIQEEAVLYGKRCFTLRKNTERPSTIESGSNVLIDLEKEEDRKKVLDFAKNPKDPEVTIPENWDGKAGERIIKELVKYFS